MGPKKRGASTKRGPSKASKSEPPAKLIRDDSGNAELRKKIDEIKQVAKSSKSKKYKCDQSLIDAYPAATIYEDYACMLNQTNISANNNKFYVIQLAEDLGEGYLCFTKWGRVGEPGTTKTEAFGEVEDAIKMFEKKFKDKTKNNWKDRENFKHAPGKYMLLEMDCDSEDEDETDSNTMAITSTTKTLGNAKIKCTLDIRTQLLIKLIFNDDMFVAQMTSMNLNVNKMPLGKLSQTQIATGLEILLELEKGIKSNESDLADLTSKFYTVIPHDFGRSKPSIINSMTIVEQKKEMMMTLSDIELTQALQKKQITKADTVHPIDMKYQKLNSALEYLDKNSDEFKLLEKYSKSCPKTRKGPLLDVWRVDRNGEGVRFATHDDIKYRKLLWHGTNVAVVAAILNSGLRIMPHSGGLVGRGIYFASEHAKSSWYVRAHHGKFEGETNVGFMFLVEVALGKMKSITQCDSTLKRAPPGYDSIVARGSSEPDPKQNEYLKFDGNDVEVPVGKPVPMKEWKKSGFTQSEYLVYKESQARIRYILKYSFT